METSRQFSIRLDGNGAIFAPSAAQGLIGKRVPVNYRETYDSPVLAELATGTVIKADLVDDGKAIMVTLELI